MASSSTSSPASPLEAAAAFKRGDFAAAERMYGALLLSEPKPEASVRSGFAVNRANCLLRLSRLSRTIDAENSCRIALRLQPDSVTAHEMLAAVLHRMVKDGQRWRIHEEVRREGEERWRKFLAGVEKGAEMFVDNLPIFHQGGRARVHFEGVPSGELQRASSSQGTASSGGRTGPHGGDLPSARRGCPARRATTEPAEV
jgi:hypothetical protein